SHPDALPTSRAASAAATSTRRTRTFRRVASPPGRESSHLHNGCMRSLLVFLLLAFSLAAPAQQDPEAIRRTVEQVEQLLKQRPTDATLWFYLARFRAELGDTKGTV